MQENRREAWLKKLIQKIWSSLKWVREAIPTVRNQGNRLERLGATLIRINPRDFHGSNRTISIASGAKDALLAIDALIH